MKLSKYLKLTLLAVIAAFTFTGCSGGSTSTGLGLSVGGGWNGILKINGAEYARFYMSIVQSATDPEDPFSSKELGGTFAPTSGNKCIVGGEIVGTLVDNQITMTIGDLRMSGTTGNTNMEGAWSDSAEDCIKGGTWTASR